MTSTPTAPSEHRPPLPQVQQIASVLWPSFLTASLATVIFFTVFDPVELALLTDAPGITRLAGYTLGFFAFWLLTSISCALTCYFRKPCPPRSPLAHQRNG